MNSGLMLSSCLFSVVYVNHVFINWRDNTNLYLAHTKCQSNTQSQRVYISVKLLILHCISHSTEWDIRSLHGHDKFYNRMETASFTM
jgi:hypothetical protein